MKYQWFFTMIILCLIIQPCLAAEDWTKIFINSTPNGARVRIDDSDFAGLKVETPFEQWYIDGTTEYHTVMLEKDGYQRWVSRVQFVASSTTVIEATLIPLNATLQPTKEMPATTTFQATITPETQTTTTTASYQPVAAAATQKTPVSIAYGIFAIVFGIFLIQRTF